MNNDPQDLISLLVALFALLVTPELARLVGPYAAIVVLAGAGSALSLSSNEKNLTNWQAAWFIFCRVLVATVLTVGIAEVLQKIVPWASPRYTLIPLAFGIGWIKDFNAVRSWFGDLISKYANKRVDDGNK